jgi:DNA mismatch repair protein MutL
MVETARAVGKNGAGASAANVPLSAEPNDCHPNFDAEDAVPTLNALATLRAIGQLRDSFILATSNDGLWIIDQHVAHERVLFEKILRERDTEKIQRQRLLMPVLIDLLPSQMIAFAEVAAELERNGFEAEPFGTRTLAIKSAPAGLEGRELERILAEVLEQDASAQSENLDALRLRVAASIACHAAIKINTPLDAAKMDWLLAELAKTEHPTSCPHGRPIALRYSLKEIQRAFSRI